MKFPRVIELVHAGVRRRSLRNTSIAVGVAGLAAVTLLLVDIDPASWITPSRGADPNARATLPPQPFLAMEPTPVGTDSSVRSDLRGLTLRATHPGRSAQEGTAELSSTGTRGQTYSAGAILANGARLAEIHADHVVLERDGRSERLDLATKGPSIAAPTPASLAWIGPQPVEPAVADSVDALSQVLRLAPQFDGDTATSLEVQRGPQTELFASLGLLEGDRIVAIDAEPVRDVSRAFESMNEIVAGRAVTVEIERQGKRERVVLDGSRLRSGS
jgi:hypothetical protein